MWEFFLPDFPTIHFSVSPSKKCRYEHSLPPIGGLGKHSCNKKKLMPTFNKRWIQCVSDGDGRRRKGRGSLRKLLDGGEGKRLGPTPNDSGDLGPAPTSPSTIHSLPPAPLLAELVVVILILHPLQPKAGKVLKHDVIICGIVGIKFNKVGVHRGICFRSS